MISAASLGDFTLGVERPLAHALDAELHGENVEFDSVSIDSRTVRQGDLFIAIRGADFDGHQFIPDAIAKGCCAVVVERGAAIEGYLDIGRPVLVVNDTTEALGVIATVNRNKFNGLVIGLTGSSGKTTTKNMLSSILSKVAPTCATAGNWNNEIGVPLTLLSINAEHKFAVVEMGARSRGDLLYLGKFVKPEIAVLLNAGTAHIDIFGNYENIVSAKGELFDVLSPGGSAIVNADDPAASHWCSKLKEKDVIQFSVMSGSSDIWAENVVCQPDVSTYILHSKDGQINISLPLPGRHNVSNSLAAAAAASAAGIDLDTIAAGLRDSQNDAGRLQHIHLPGDLLLIDDSYNANPASVQAALEVLSLRPGNKMAVLGEMAELGAVSQEMHEQVARYAASTTIDSFYLIGTFADRMAACIGERAKVFSDKQTLADELCLNSMAGDSILIKGSRVAAMNDIVDNVVDVMKGRAH